MTKVHSIHLDPHQKSFSKKNQHGFDVLVKGAVEHPGVYHLSSDMQMKDLLAIAGVKNTADLKRYSEDSWIKKGRVVNVLTQQMISVHLQGAVKGPSTLKLPKGSKVNDILNVIQLDEDADIEILQKKRLIKDNETFLIPHLKP